MTVTLLREVFPAASVARAFNVCGPFVTVAVFQEVLYVGPAPVTGAPKSAPSRLNWRLPVTPTLSVAVAVTGMVPPFTYDPFPGAVIETTGGMLSIVTVTLLREVFPAASVARASNVCGPFCDCRSFPGDAVRRPVSDRGSQIRAIQIELHACHAHVIRGGRRNRVWSRRLHTLRPPSAKIETTGDVVPLAEPATCVNSSITSSEE